MDARDRNRIDVHGAGGVQGLCHGRHRCTRRENVIDDDDSFAVDVGCGGGTDREGVPHVAQALLSSQSTLAGRAAYTPNAVDQNLPAGLRADGLGDQRRLVEASCPQPRPVQRHRNDDIGVVQQCAASTHRPRREQGHQIVAVAVLQFQDQRPCRVVIQHRRPGAFEGRWPFGAVEAHRRIAEIEFERATTACAHRIGDERDPRPTIGTQRRRRIDLGAAQTAMRRQGYIQQSPAQDADKRGRRFRRWVGGVGGRGHSGSMTDDIAVFNRALVRTRRDRHAAGLREYDFLVREIADRLVDRLDDVTRRFPIALDLGCRGGLIGDVLAGRGGIETLIQTDLSRAMADRARPHGPVCVADEEALPFADASLDLVISSLALHWVNDLPGTLIQVCRALRPDGLLLAALFGGETLYELRAALADAELETTGGVSPRVSPFADVRDLGALMQRAGFALPVVDAETITVSYAEPLSLMRDLRGMAESNAVAQRRSEPLRRVTLMRACERYAEVHSDADGRIPATFQILFLTGWAPAPSQPKALKPGQAAARLAEALGAEEGSFDEKAVPIAPRPVRD